MAYSIEETIKLNELFDIYQELLTDKQKEYFKYYFSDNYSLSEIAEILKVSRNAVHLQIKNVVTNLLNFETKLKINERNNLIEELLNSLVVENLNDKTNTIIKKIEKVK
ncbi:MAG: sigma factor-like helix-turn-helix DNA-binding protein [Candidatus Izemoplasmatales bacterium]